MPGWLLAAWIGACGADAVTTHGALQAGAVELHLSQNPWVTDALVGAQAGVGAWGMARLHRTHPKLATGILVGLTAIRMGAAVHNATVLWRMR